MVKDLYNLNQVQNFKVIGKMIKLLDKVLWNIVMEIYIKVNIWIVKKMDKVYINSKVVHNIKANSKMIVLMVKVN